MSKIRHREPVVSQERDTQLIPFLPQFVKDGPVICCYTPAHLARPLDIAQQFMSHQPLASHEKL